MEQLLILKLKGPQVWSNYSGSEDEITHMGILVFNGAHVSFQNFQYSPLACFRPNPRHYKNRIKFSSFSGQSWQK